MWVIVVAGLLLAATCLSTALSLSLRHMSRARMAELAAAKGCTDKLESFFEHVPEMTLNMSTLRMTINLCLVLLFALVLRDDFDLSPMWVYFVSVFIISAVLILIFSVAIPNAWAKYAGEKLIVACLPLLGAARVLLRPIALFLRLFDGLVRRLADVHVEQGGNGHEQIEQEILNAVSEGEAHGAVDEEEKEMIESVIALDELQVGQIMTPRTDIVALPSTATLFEAKELIVREGHSRIPVFEESLDNVLGVLYAKDLLRYDRTDDFDATEVMRTVPFVPETKSLRNLLREFREKKVHIALVLDEYGGTAGLITIEDIVEELIGEIVDEFEPPEPEPINRVDDDTMDIDARVHVNEINEELGIKLPEDEDYETVGGFVFSTLGRIPKSGEELSYENVKIHVIDAEPRKINRLRIHVVHETQQAETEQR